MFVMGLLLSAALLGCEGNGNEGLVNANLNAHDLNWRSDAKASLPRQEVTAAVIDQAIHVIGGISIISFTNWHEVYHVDTDSWEVSVPYPVPIHHSTVLADQGRLYAFGGYPAFPFTSLALAFSWSPGDLVWTALPLLPRARGAHGAALVDGKIYLIGGNDILSRQLAEVDVFDIATQTWSRAADLPTPREHLSVTTQDGLIYAIGGRLNTLTTNLATFEVYDPQLDQWKSLPDMPTARGGGAAVSYRGQIVMLGGERSDGTYEAVEAYDPVSQTWSRLPDLATSRHGLAAAVVNDRLYSLLGGPNPTISFSTVNESLGSE